MFRNIFENIDGVALLPTIALVLFFCFFIALIVWMVRLDKMHIRHMEQMPLDIPNSNNGNGGYHG